MPRRYTKAKTKQVIQELLTLQPAMERYRHLEQEVKTALTALKQDEMTVEAGRVFISASERMTLDPSVARVVLGPDLAQKVIKVTETISNPLLKALYEMGDISDDQMDDLRNQAEKKQIISLHVRPLK